MIVYSYNGKRGAGKTTILKKLNAAIKRKWLGFGCIERFESGKIFVAKDNGRCVGVCADCRTVQVVVDLFKKVIKLGFDILVVEGDGDDIVDAIKNEVDKYGAWQYRSRLKEPRKPVLPYSQDKNDVQLIMKELSL